MDDADDLVHDHDAVPPGRYVATSRGRLFVRETGPLDGPTLVLLHGWVGTAAVNWLLVYPRLAAQFRVIAPDLRGHGRGPRSNTRFRLTDCAADVGALIETLDLDDIVLVGFSMGGPVAQLTWRTHSKRIAGLVLCATSYRFVSSSVARMAVTSIVPALARGTRLAEVGSRLPLAGLRRVFPA